MKKPKRSRCWNCLTLANGKRCKFHSSKSPWPNHVLFIKTHEAEPKPIVTKTSARHLHYGIVQGAQDARKWSTNKKFNELL